MRTRSTLVLSILFLFQVISFSMKFERITVDDGLPNSRVVSLFQDSLGYVWFTTHAGMSRYNGSDIVNYNIFTPSENGVETDEVLNCAVYSSEYDILCGTKSGNLYRYNRVEDRFENMLDFTFDGKVFNIHDVFVDEHKGIWFGTNNSLFYMDVNTHKVQRKLKENISVYHLESDGAGKLFLGTSKGLKVYDRQNQTLLKLSMDGETALNLAGDIRSMLVRSDYILVGNSRSELIKLSIENNSVKVLNRLNLGSENGVIPIQDITINPKGNYVVASDGNGLYRLSPELEIIDNYKADVNDNTSLSSNGIYDVFYGTNNALWVATYGGGVCYYDPNRKPFEKINHLPYVRNSLRNNIVNAVLESNSGEMWYGTRTGISIYNKTKQKWNHIFPRFNHKNSNLILHLCKGQNNDIWAATYGKGLIRFNSEDYSFKSYTKKSKAFTKTESNHLYAVHCDTDGKIWSGGIWGNLTVMDFKEKTRRVLIVPNVRTILEDGDKMIIGTVFGLFVVEKTSLKTTQPSIDILLNSRVICLSKADKQGCYLVGLDSGGLIYWNANTNTIKQYQTKDGFPSNYIRDIIKVDEQVAWVSTTRGICKFNMLTEVVESYKKQDGLSGTEFTENGGFFAPNGLLYFAGIKGVTRFLPNKIVTSSQKATPTINTILLKGKKLEITDEGPLKQNINFCDGLSLSYNQNSITFNLGAISYTSPEQIQYRWKLEGHDDDWNSVTSTREAHYSSLPSGKYVFRLQLTNDDGIWQAEERTFSIKIARPIWQSNWAYLGYFILFSILIFLSLNYYNVLIHDKHSKEKQQFFISVAHDLRTPLSLIKLPVQKMVQAKDLSEWEKNNLTLVKRNVDRLTNLVNQLLDFQKSDLNKMKLQVRDIQFPAFIQKRIQLFKPLADNKSIETLFVNQCETDSLWVDKNKMEKILYNLISNAYKYTPEQGKITITLKEKGKYIALHVKDTGEGIPQSQQKNIFQRYYRATNAINSKEVGSGVGLMLTKQLVELHHGKITFTSEQGVGSEFIVKLKKGKEHYVQENFMGEREDIVPVPVIGNKKIVSEKATGDGPRILLVEDNPELLEALRNELKSDFEVLIANDGVEGVTLAKKYSPNLIVSDVMMPNMNGHQLCNALKEAVETCHIPIILLTALDSPDYKKEGLDQGADAYLEKPFDIDLLQSQINNLLRSREMLKKKFLLPTSDISEASPTKTDNDLLCKTKAYILSNLDSSQLSVENIAIEIGISRPVLYRKIKSLTDLSPQQFLLTIKLKEAARMLKEEQQNVSETAYSIGFSDPKYFSQTFKKHFGVTPTEFVKS